MQADEQVGLVVVRHGRPIVERHVAVLVSRQQHADAEPAFDRRLDSPRDGQREILFLGAALPLTPSSSPPCPGSIAIVLRPGACCAERGRIAGLAPAPARELPRRRGGVGCGDVRSIVSRIVVSIGCEVARNAAKRGPRSTAIVVASTTRTFCTRLCAGCGREQRVGRRRARRRRT